MKKTEEDKLFLAFFRVFIIMALPNWKGAVGTRIDMAVNKERERDLIKKTHSTLASDTDFRCKGRSKDIPKRITKGSWTNCR